MSGSLKSGGLVADDEEDLLPSDVFVTPLGAVQGKTEFYKIVGGAKGKELTHHVLACEILLGHKAPLEDVRMNGINLSAYRVCSTAQTEARRRQRVVEARAEARALEVVAMDTDE